MRTPSRRRMLGLLGGAAGVAAVGVTMAGHRAASEPLEGSTPITVTARRIEHFSLRDHGLSRFGALQFIGGLELSSADRDFGGLSGAAVSADGGRLTAVTDRGMWFGATLRTEGDTPVGLADAVLAPILAADGRPLARWKRSDSEGLALAADGMAYVSFERVHEVMRFNLARNGLEARAEALPRPAGAARLRPNKGLEAVAVVNAGPFAGSVIAIAEAPPRDEDDRPTVPGWFVTGPKGAFEVVRHETFAVTDAAFLPDGDLLLLERSFAWLDGVAMRIRRIPGRDVKPGARLVGEEIVKADMRMQVDNMEALAVHRGPDGRPILTLLSDDNFSFLQRTILLRFRLVA